MGEENTNNKNQQILRQAKLSWMSFCILFALEAHLRNKGKFLQLEGGDGIDDEETRALVQTIEKKRANGEGR
jgi:hypothetical protein